MNFLARKILKLVVLLISFALPNSLYAPKQMGDVNDYYQNLTESIFHELNTRNVLSESLIRYFLLVFTIRLSMAISGGGLNSAIADAVKLVEHKKDALFAVQANHFDGLNIYQELKDGCVAGDKQRLTLAFLDLCLAIYWISMQGKVDAKSIKTTLLDEEILDFFLYISDELKGRQGPVIMTPEIINHAFMQVKKDKFESLEGGRLVKSMTVPCISIPSCASIDSADSPGPEASPSQTRPSSARGVVTKFDSSIDLSVDTKTSS